MKQTTKLTLAIILAILCVGLGFASALADGVSIPTPVIRGEKDRSFNIPIPPDDLEEITDSYVSFDHVMDDIILDNYYDLISAYNEEPQWSLTLVSGTDLHGYLKSTEWAGVEGITLYITDRPKTTGEIIYMITCSCGGRSDYVIRRLNIITLDSFPSNMNCQDSYTVKAGETLAISCDFVPAGWAVPYRQDRYSFQILDWYNQADFGDNFVLTSHFNDRIAYFRGVKPGVYLVKFWVCSGNINCWRDIPIIVTDENGNAPGRAPSLYWLYPGGAPRDGDTFDLAIIPENQNVVSNDTFACTIHMHNYELLEEAYGGEPNWNIRYEGTPAVEFRLEGRQNHIVLRAPNPTPQSPCTVHLTICFGWGPWRSYMPLTINYVNASLPAGTNLPDTIRLRLGQTTAVSASLTPENYSFRNHPWAHADLRNGRDDFMDYFDMGDERYDGRTLHITPKDIAPGYYTGYIDLHDRNVCCGKDVVLIVEDENGNVPAPAPRIDAEEYAFDLCAAPPMGTGGDEVVSSRGLIRWNLDNYDVMRLHYPNEDPVWTIETDLDVECRAIGKGDEAQIFLTGRPTILGVHDIRMICTWGGQSDSIVFKVNVKNYAGALPTGTTLPGVIRARQGQQIAVTGDYVGSSESPWFTQLLPDGDLADIDWNGEEFRTCLLTCRAPGAVGGYGYVGGFENLRMQKKIVYVFKATDRVFTLPGDIQTIEANAFEGIAAETVVIPDGCKTIGSRAFANCSRLVEIVIPASVTRISNDAFSGCSNFVINSSGDYVQRYASAYGILCIDD